MRASILLLLFLLAGCAPAVTLHSLERTESVPKGMYVGYALSTGELEHLRVVFLKAPGAKVDVEAASDFIRIIPMSYEQAVEFVRRTEPPQTLDIQTVRHRGDLIGYLLTYMPSIVVRRTDEWLEVDFYERDGKVHFVVNKRFKADG
jgi:hypothetical protein